MCGIVAYIGKRDVFPILINGLHRLEYRGYDSAGVAILNGDLKVYKKAGKVSDLAEFVKGKDVSGHLGMGRIRAGLRMVSQATETLTRFFLNRKNSPSFTMELLKTTLR